MIGIVVATHGEFGKVLLATLKGILGEAAGMTAVALEAVDSLETFRTKLQKAMGEVDPQGEGVLVLVDMLGGTPFNVGLKMAQAGPDKVAVVTGVNLPMLITAASHRGTGGLSDLAREVQVATRGAVTTSVELFGQ
jgi:mannose/fructose/sorbose-specific phosphotransferase system IIA component